MTKIEKWLKSNNIAFYEDKKRNTFDRAKRFIIEIEKNCVWINGLGEEMRYDRRICIGKDSTYKTYRVVEKTGYNTTKTHCQSTRQDDIISCLEKIREDLL